MKKIYLLCASAIVFFWASALHAQITTFDYTETIVSYTVPFGVTNIKITAMGAQGGYTGGLGANMSGNFSVVPGQVLEILVGSEGAFNTTSGNEGGAGGGGSFVVDQATSSPLIIAGGGGGGCLIGAYDSYGGPYNAAITNAQLSEEGASTSGGGGGTGGNGAAAGFTDCCLVGGVGGSGGGGFFTAGGDGSTGSFGGMAYVEGGAGGACGSTDPISYPVSGAGGFGGGGGSAMDNAFRAGGGGGYSGGQGAVYISGGLGYLFGGGGGSFNSGSDQVNLIDHTGNGQIIIEILCSAITVTVSDDAICLGDSFIIEGSGLGTISWDGGVENGVPFTPATAGIYTYTSTSDDPGDCGYSLDIEVFELPTITYTTVDEIIGADGSIDITVTGGVPAYSFDWDNDGTGDWDDAEDLTGLAGGTYTVAIEDEAGCTSTETIVANSQLGIEINGENTISIYPNPTTSTITILAAGSFTYEITDVNGAILMRASGVNTKEVSLEEFANGIYFVNLTIDGELTTFQVVKN